MMVVGLSLLILAAEPACPPCATGAQCIDGKCQFTCQSNADCRPAHVCLDVGICDDELPLVPGQPRMIKRGDATHPSHFRYAGTVPEGYVRKQAPNWWGVLRGVIVFSVGYGGAGALSASFMLPDRRGSSLQSRACGSLCAERDRRHRRDPLPGGRRGVDRRWLRDPRVLAGARTGHARAHRLRREPRGPLLISLALRSGERGERA